MQEFGKTKIYVAVQEGLAELSAEVRWYGTLPWMPSNNQRQLSSQRFSAAIVSKKVTRHLKPCVMLCGAGKGQQIATN